MLSQSMPNAGSDHESAACHGFTLVELLFVIAIIGTRQGDSHELYGVVGPHYLINRSGVDWGRSSIAGSKHNGGAFALLCDGAVGFLVETIADQAYRNLMDRRDGNVTGTIDF